MKRTQLFIDIVAILYILLFMYTGVYKLVNHTVFSVQLMKHEALKDIYPIVSWAVPIAEIIAVVLLMFSVTRIKGIIVSLILMVSFTTYLIYMMMTSPKLPCSCGGIINTLSWHQHIIVNSIFILLAITAIIFHRKFKFPGKTFTALKPGRA